MFWRLWLEWGARVVSWFMWNRRNNFVLLPPIFCLFKFQLVILIIFYIFRFLSGCFYDLYGFWVSLISRSHFRLQLLGLLKRLCFWRIFKSSVIIFIWALTERNSIHILLIQSWASFVLKVTVLLVQLLYSKFSLIRYRIFLNFIVLFLSVEWLF